MVKYKVYSIGLALAGLGACTSLSEGQESLPPPARVNERVTVYEDPTESVLERMDEQASEINRKRNIEQFDRNSPAMTPTDMRPKQLPYAPVDSARHNLMWPIMPPQPVPPPPPAGSKVDQ